MIHVLKVLNKAFCFLSNHGWKIIALLIIFLYAGGYISMLCFGEENVTYRYTWWFVVTVTTVGYGDLSPSSYGGQITGIIIMLFGIGAFALLIGKIAEGVYYMSEKQIRGLIPLKLKNHIIIMGYRGISTHKLVDEILGDGCREHREIVLCSTHLDRNPFDPDKVKFVKGELASDDVLERSCAKDADKVIIRGDNDDQSFLTAYAVRQINKHAHFVVYMRNDDHQDKVYCLPADFKDLNQVVMPSSTYLMVQEMQDPESSHVLQHLMSNLNGATLYRLDIPNHIFCNWNFIDIFIYFRTKLEVTVLAVKNDKIISNPPMDMNIHNGMALFYIGNKRIKNISWNEI